MDKLKTRVLFISLIILALLSVSAVAAADSDDVISADQDDFDLSEETITDVEQTSADAQDDTGAVVSADEAISNSNAPLSAEGDGNYSDLQTLIDGTDEGQTLKLDMNYTRSNGETFLNINKEIIIDGQGHTIDASLGNILRSYAWRNNEY